MNEYQEYNLVKVGNNYDQWMLYGDKDGERGDWIATFNDKNHAKLVVEFFNQRIKEAQDDNRNP